MGFISLSIPLSGQPNSTEDPKVASDLTTIQTAINGNLDATNISPTAAITFSQLNLGSWVNMAPASGINGAVPGAYVASSRLQGDTVRLKGQLLNSSGSTFVANGALAVVNSAHYPTAGVQFQVPGGASTVTLTIDTTGHLSISTTLANGAGVSLDGVTYTIA